MNYDSNQSEVNITYDSLNRILTKNISSSNYLYTYDVQYQGTLTNISFSNNSIKYKYDNGLRVIEEIRTIDGIEFKKNYYYDSSDRIVKITLSSGQSIEYFYNEQGQIDSIKGVINSTKHNSLDKPLNRTYANNLTTNFSYDSQTLRLTEIKTGAIQELDYSYDPVGNIIAINDTVNHRSQTMTYDSLDRLLSMSINNGQSFAYTYNPIGNILKIVRDSKNTTKFVYGNKPVHAPSQIVIGDSGIDVQKQNILYANGSTKFFLFYISNENNASLSNINWTIDGNPIINSSIAFNINTNESIIVLAENNYTNTGIYGLNISSQAPGAYDFEIVNFTLGVKLTALSILNNTLSSIFYRLSFLNDFSLTSPSVRWNCTDGVISSVFTLAPNEALINITYYNYSSPGIKNLTCFLVGDSNITRSIEIVIRGIEIENITNSLLEENRRNVSFVIRNYYDPLSVSYNISSENQSYSGIISVTNVTSISQVLNYSTDGQKTVIIRINATNTSDIYNETLTVRSLKIENYTRSNSSITIIYRFNIKNYWSQALSVSWNISNPLYVNSSFTLQSNESISVYFEHNYSHEAKNTEINAYSNQFKDSIIDIISSKTLLANDEVLFENTSSSIAQYTMKNLNVSQSISWNLDTSAQNISSTLPITLDNQEEVISVIEFNYSSRGVYAYTYRINSSINNDNATGVVIIE